MRSSCWCGRIEPCPEHTRHRNAHWSTNRDRRLQARLRRALLVRAGGRCEWVEDGRRCSATTDLRAAHRVPLRHFDAGDPRAYDIQNGRLLCREHDLLTDPLAR